MTVTHEQGPSEVETALHRLAPECKVLVTILFVVAVALLPQRALWAFATDAVLLGLVIVYSRASLRSLATRLLIEIPFVLFIVLLPFIASGPRIEVLGISLAREGLWGAWAIGAKATIAVLTTGVLAATTPTDAILTGTQRLKVPSQFTSIASFGVRYLQLVLDELKRLQLARVARGDDPRWIWQARTAARSAGALAVRCFDRGERVYLAMLARGFDGHFPEVDLGTRARGWEWTAVMPFALAAIAATVLAKTGVL